jgi:hypothetical protein
VRLIVGIGTLHRDVLIDAHIQTQIYCKLQQPVMKSCGFIFQNRLVPLELCCKDECQSYELSACECYEVTSACECYEVTGYHLTGYEVSVYEGAATAVSTSPPLNLSDCLARME